MNTEDRIRQERLKKLQDIRKQGIDPYPASFKKTHDAGALQEKYAHTADLGDTGEKKNGEKKTGKAAVKAAVAGRLMSLRRMGKSAFGHLLDTTGSIQIFMSQDRTSHYSFLQFIDRGDILGIEGSIFRTKTGELTVEAKTISLLAKSLEPLPEKFHGLVDTELRYRERYTDLVMNPQVKKTFEMRSRIFQAMREFLLSKGYVEVETPILQPVYGGAAARPFTTKHNTLGMNLYLRISNELYLKRLLVGGFEKVFEFSKDFRNEGIDTQHNPEFTLMETMTAYHDYNDSMKLTEEMLASVCQAVLGTTEIGYQGTKISFKPPFAKMTMLEAVKKHTPVDFTNLNAAQAKEAAQKLKVPLENKETKGAILAAVYDETVESKLIQPTFILDYPKEVSPLAKAKPANPDFTERFELVINGREIANVYTELNDPGILKENWKQQEQLLKKGDEEAQRTDKDFLKALEVGMPPASGIGIGMDRLVMLLTNSASIRDVLFFPAMREK